MVGRTTAAHDAAQDEFLRAKGENKPSARELAAKYGLSESTIHRASWFKEYKKAKAQKEQLK